MLRALVIDQLSHRETFQIPYGRLLCEPSFERILTDIYGSEGWRDICRNAIKEFTGMSVKNKALKGSQYQDPYGTVWDRARAETVAHIVEPAIPEPTPASLRALQMPDAEALLNDEWMEHLESQCAANRSLFTAVSWGNGIFTRAWQLCGFEDALCYMVAEPEFFEDLIDRVTEHQIALANRICMCSADAVFIGDDWGAQRSMLMNPDLWREVIRPRYARIVAAIKSHGKYLIHHSCGDIAPVVGDLCDIGVDCLQSVQPEAMDPYVLKEKHGDRIAFWGGLGSQSLIPYGTPDEIHREVERLCRHMAKGGGYILGPAKHMQEDTPPENFFALADAFNRAFHGEFSTPASAAR